MAGPLRTTLGQFLINEELPEDLRDYNRVLDKKGIGDLLRQVAQEKPDEYRRISHKLSQIGSRASYLSGGNSFGLAHMRKATAAKDIQLQIKDRLRQVLDDDNLSDKQRNDLILSTVGKHMKAQQQQIFDESWAEGNPLARQIHSGSRGNNMNLASLRGSDMLYSDHHDRVIPIPVLSSYSQGFTPSEYWAGAYGARKGIMATKFATQDAGFLSKQLNQVAHRLLVTGDDNDSQSDTLRGLPVDTDDEDNAGALLAADAGPYKRNTVLTPKILRDLTKRKLKRILVRSPMVGGASDGGVNARDVGIREDGRLPARGTNVGLAAAQALSEPLSQAQMSAKHSGGVAGEERALGGFDYINQLIQVPKRFKGGAAHAQLDGKVESVKPAPTGGFHVTVNGEPHYVGEGYAVNVKPGDTVEAGDVISEGSPNPAEVVKHKGIGEGKRYFVKAYMDAYKNAGLKANRRNAELLSRGLINHVRLSEEMGEFVPEDVVSYSALERQWEPRPDTQELDAKRSIGRYLEKPYLHYSIGTRVRPSVVKELNDFGIASVATHAEPPPFEAEMIRGMSSLQHDPDWMVRMYGSGLKSSLLKGVHRGASSTDQGTSFVPGLAKSIDFGRTGLVRTPREQRVERGQTTVPVSQGLMSQRTTNPTQGDSPTIKFSADLNILKAGAGLPSSTQDEYQAPSLSNVSTYKTPKSPTDANYTGRAGGTSGTTPKPQPAVRSNSATWANSIAGSAADEPDYSAAVTAPNTSLGTFQQDRASQRMGQQQQTAQAAADNYSWAKPWTWGMLGGSGGEVQLPEGRQTDYQGRAGYAGNQSAGGGMPFMNMLSPEQQAAFVQGTGVPAAGIGMMAAPQLMSKLLGGTGADQPYMTRDQFRQGITEQGMTPGSGGYGEEGPGWLAMLAGGAAGMAKSYATQPYAWAGGGLAGALGSRLGQTIGQQAMQRFFPAAAQKAAPQMLQRALNWSSPTAYQAANQAVRTGIQRYAPSFISKYVAPVAAKGAPQVLGGGLAGKALGQAGGVLGSLGLLDAADYVGALPQWAGGTGMGQGFYNAPEGGSAMNTQGVEDNLRTMQDPNSGIMDQAGAVLGLGSRPFTSVAYANQVNNQMEQDFKAQQAETAQRNQAASRAQAGSLDRGDLQSYANTIGVQNMNDKQLDAYMQSPTMRQAIQEGTWQKNPATGKWVDPTTGMPMQQSMANSRRQQLWSNARSKGMVHWEGPQGEVQSRPIIQMSPQERAQHGVTEQEYQQSVQRREADNRRILAEYQQRQAAPPSPWFGNWAGVGQSKQ